jgi:hypothetical protein
VVVNKDKEIPKQEVKLESAVLKRKVRSSSFSLSDIMGDKIQEKEVLNSSPKKMEPFEEEKMQKVWSVFSDKVKQSGRTNLFITLSSSVPILKEKTKIHLKISNDAQQKILDENKIELMDHLRTSLQNDYIELQTEISEDIQSNVPYTPKDKFIKMTEDNPSLKILQQKLGLDPDY